MICEVNGCFQDAEYVLGFNFPMTNGGEGEHEKEFLGKMVCKVCWEKSEIRQAQFSFASEE